MKFLSETMASSKRGESARGLAELRFLEIIFHIVDLKKFFFKEAARGGEEQ